MMKPVLDSRQLLAARVLANTGSFTLAGQQLSLTQSAVSHAIKALEEEVECRLFTRTGKGVKVTAAGKQFLQYADKILLQMETARTLVAPRLGRGKERLRVGVSAWSRENILPAILPAFQKEFPNKSVALESGGHTHNLELLEAGLLDLAFTVCPAHHPGLEFMLLFEDELRFIVAAHHPWARRGRALSEELASNTLLLHPGDYNLPALLAEHFQREKLSLRHTIEIDNFKTLKAVVRTGLAVGVIPTGLIGEDLDEGTLAVLTLGTRPLVLQWGVVYQHQRQLAPMERRFIELYRQAVPGVLSRLQGHATPVPEKKEEAGAVMALAEPYLKCSGAAAFLAASYNFLSDSMAWVNAGSIAMAAS
jgi:DNA-binding transcriptional LysR family regulator